MFNFCEEFLIAWYCEEVAKARRELASVSCKSVDPLLVAASAIWFRWMSRACSARSLAGKEDGPDAAWNTRALGELWVLGLVVESAMPWSAVAEEALLKTSPRSPVAHCFYAHTKDRKSVVCA